MPIVEDDRYQPPWWARNAHINTIYAALGRTVHVPEVDRERIATPDGDFLDLDRIRQGSDRLVILLHGLEGSADRPYMLGMAKAFSREGWDTLAINFRGCSGEPNLQLRTYHMGETSDLNWVIERTLDNGTYRQLGLIGFSLGGNVLLKYLGEREGNLPSELSFGVAFSVPCHISSANIEIARWHNALYRYRFMASLAQKVEEKARRFPDRVVAPQRRLYSFREFDDHFTAPVHGFRDAEEYWQKSGALQYLGGIQLPALLVNARDDTFLSQPCYPYELARKSSHLYLQTPRFGGHVGFVQMPEAGGYWSEQRAVEFASEVSGN